MQTLWRSTVFAVLILVVMWPSAIPIAEPLAVNAARQKAAAPPDYRPAITASQTAARALRESMQIPGLSVAVGVNGQVVWAEGFGQAHLEQRTPVTPQTRFRLGSVSKMLTVAAVARLYEAGKLDLDAPLQRYVPSFPDKGQQITARQLAGHLGGIRHYQARDYSGGRNIDLEHYDTILSALKIFQDDPLVAPPGTRYFYSTFGYTLLSQVVESAAQQNFLTYVDEQVLRPLRLTNTAADKPELIIPQRTGFYERSRDGQIVNAAYVDSSYKWAGGGFLSTAEDLVIFGSAHLRPGFFKADTLALLFTSQRMADGKETGVGLGWRSGTDAMKRRMLHHAGSINGGRAVLVLYPATGVVVALLSNLGQTPAAVEKEAQALAEPFLTLQEKTK
ncbi:MAG: serine hydrolase domain-containing protein [Blastocatellia bacterium]